MAVVNLDVHFNSLGGHLGNFVFYNTRGRQFVRRYVMPRNPDTDGQKIVRKTFADAVRSWQGLQPEEKYRYNRKARCLHMSGYNLYISGYIKNNLEFYRKNCNILITADMLSEKGVIPYSSVTSAYLTGYGPIYSPVQVLQDMIVR